MKKIYLFVLICMAFLSMASAAIADDLLSAGFRNPPTSAKARTWWHWINGNVTKEGITADLEAMKQVGIQEAQIFNVDQGYPEGSAEFLSSEWLECFHFAVSEAKRLGLEIGFHNGAGWSSSGGSWVTPEYAMQTVVYSETRCDGGSLIQKKLVEPATKLDYYKDIAVLAFPTPQDGMRLDNREMKTLSGNSFPNHLQPDAKLIPAAALIRKSDVINISSKMLADGTLKWSAPSGKWTILRIGHTPTGAENRPANLSGRGLECDKLSRAAMDVYWAGGIEPVLAKLGPLVGPHLTNCLIDSYEVGCGNWTAGFEKEFARRCTYDCVAFLPTLAGYYVESGEISERFLWDYRRTLGEMMADNYFDYFRELCHKRGMKFSVEPYGGPFDCMAVGAIGDIPMSEFWVGGNSFREMSKLAASAAHLNGIAVVGAESFSADNHNSRFLNQPSTMKPLGDWAWSEGVNRFIFHTYAHQPWNIAPGMTFHMYGTEISRLNTWWEPGRAYMDYLAKSQFLLQQGRCAADVLVFTGESSPNDGVYRADIKELGYDYDEIGITMISSLTVKDGLIRTPVGGAYKMLVLPQSPWMTPELLRKLWNLAKEGAMILGSKPMKSPSLRGFPTCDTECKKLVDKLWGVGETKNSFIRNITVKDALSRIDLTPDFTGGTSGSDLLFIHRIVNDTDIYFVSNQRKQYRTEMCKFRIVGKQPECWNPETGKIETIASWQSDHEGTSIPLSFAPEESYFIVFKKPTSKVAEHIIHSTLQMLPAKVSLLPDLKIIKAEYGCFLPEGIADVTNALISHINEGHSEVLVGNELVNDPAPGVSKELRVEYYVGEKMHKMSVLESQILKIPVIQQTGDFRLVKALYGKFTPEFNYILPKLPIDVTSKVNRIVASNQLVFTVGDKVFGEDKSDKTVGKQFRLVYSVEGEVFEVKIPEGGEVDLTLYNPQPKLSVEAGNLTWITPQPGSITYTTALGATTTAWVEDIPAVIEIAGVWDVHFPPNKGVVEQATFDHLYSWSESLDKGVRYFSGTATYKKQVVVPQEYLAKGQSLELDIGKVCVMAEVIVNGKNIGVLWKEPFRINLGDAIKEGENEIQIRVTNLWPNRLIGDALLYPEDCEFGDWLPKHWPDWLVNKAQRTSGRTTFATWRHWGANDSLQSSGLLGPVILRPYVHLPLLNAGK